MVFGEFITVMDVMLISLGVTCRWQTSVKSLMVTWLLEPKLSKKNKVTHSDSCMSGDYIFQAL